MPLSRRGFLAALGLTALAAPAAAMRPTESREVRVTGAGEVTERFGIYTEALPPRREGSMLWIPETGETMVFVRGEWRAAR